MKILAILFAAFALPCLYTCLYVLAAWIHTKRVPEHEPGKAEHFTAGPDRS